MLRTVSEAPRPPEEIGWSNAWWWPRWFRYGANGGSLSGFGTKLLCSLNRDGWLFDLNAGFGGVGRNVGYRVACVGRRKKSKFRSENAGMDGQRVRRIKNSNDGNARVGTACQGVGGSAPGWEGA